jgi:5-(carboxyamino)imidazole ribonucleotide synthase
VHSEADLLQGVARIGRPAVLKTAALGYDGKGQVALGRHRSAGRGAAWSRECVPKSFIDLERDLGDRRARRRRLDVVLRAIRQHASTSHPDVTVAPADIPANVAFDAIEVTREVLEGPTTSAFCIEFFVARDGRLLVNELAPRPHNSGTSRSTRAAPVSSSSRCVPSAASRSAPICAAGGRGEPARRSLGERRAELPPRWRCPT